MNKKIGDILGVLDLNTVEEDAVLQDSSRPKATLEEIQKMGAELEVLRANAADLESHLGSVNKQIARIEEGALPEALLSLGLRDFALTSGARVILSENISCSAAGENREDALSWLRENNHGDLIKNEIRVSFGRDEDAYALKVLSKLAEMRGNKDIVCGAIEQTQKVEPQTLKAFIKGLLAEGTPFPADTFKVRQFNVVKFKAAK